MSQHNNRVANRAEAGKHTIFQAKGLEKLELYFHI